MPGAEGNYRPRCPRGVLFFGASEGVQARDEAGPQPEAARKLHRHSQGSLRTAQDQPQEDPEARHQEVVLHFPR